MKSIFVKIFSFFLSIFSMLACGVKNPTFPNPYKAVDLSKFEMTFDDEFDGELDRNVWSGHYTYGDASSVRHGSFWNNYIAYPYADICDTYHIRTCRCNVVLFLSIKG